LRQYQVVILAATALVKNGNVVDLSFIHSFHTGFTSKQDRWSSNPRKVSHICCSVLPLCSKHWLDFLEKHNISVFLVLFFISACWHTAKTTPRACWRHYPEVASSTKSCTKSKLLILQHLTVTLLSIRLWLFIQPLST